MNTTQKRGSQAFGVPADYPNKRRGDCGIVAVAIAANVSYGKAWQTVRAVWDRTGRWKGGTTVYEREMAMKRLKAKIPQKVKLPRGMTVKTFVFQYATPDKRYWVQAGTHIATCILADDQIRVVDQRDRTFRPTDKARWLGCHIKGVWSLD